MIENLAAPQTHFHIHWLGANRFDWECFGTQVEANQRALELAHPGELFRIEEISANCPIRERLLSRELSTV